MLYLVPTPLGNLEDITARALRVLKEARAVLCEDTRRTRVLMSHFGLHAPLERYDDRDERTVEKALRRLENGEDLALVSDSGTPVLSDPGLKLVARARAAGIPVVSLPGPCAAAAAAAGSGLPADSFVFLGFLPRAPGRRRRALSEAAALGRTLVVYESPYRVLDLLETAEAALGPVPVAVCRELSKVHEEWLTGALPEVRRRLAERKEILGEFVVVLRPAKGGGDEPDDPD